MKHNKFNKMNFIITFLCITLTFIIITDLYGRRNGITGRTSTTSQGCNCHSNTTSSSTTLTLLSDLQTFTVDQGSTTTFTVRVSNSNLSAAGVNIAVKTTQTGETNIGSLSPTTGSGLTLSNSELTHTSPKSLNGGVADFTFTWTAPNQPGVYYIRAIGIAVNNNGRDDSGDLWNWMTPQAITVRGLTVTSPNGGENFCTGTTQTISWTQYGINNVKIELSTDGGNTFPITLANNVPAQNGSWSWSIPPNLQTGTNFKIRISDVSATNVSDVSDGVFSISSQLNISSHPQSAGVCEGSSITFSVAASGGGLSYQWRKNGININGATQSSYTIGSVDTTHQGNYDVVVSNQCGNPVVSNVATLTVKRKTVIQSQPQSSSACLGGSITFKVKAEGTNLSFQWQHNGNNIPGATDSVFQLNNISLKDSGFYSVIVSGACGSPISSNRVKLSVLKPPSIKTQPSNRTACEGKSVEFFVNAEGDSLTYQWFKNGIPINGATKATFTISYVQKSDEGDYTVLVKGSCEPSTYSNPATLKVISKLVITKQPEDQTIVEGSTARFYIFVNGDVKKYQWRKNGIALNGQNSYELIINNVQMSDTGIYDCVITNDCDTLQSKSVKLNVFKKGKGSILSVNQSTIDFGYVLLNKKKEFNELKIENKGDSVLIISQIYLTGTNQNDFELAPINFPISLEPNQSLPISISFKANTSGEKSAKINFVSNSSTNVEINLISRCIDLRLSDEFLDFGTIPVNSNKELQLTLINSGIIPIEIKDIKILGNDSLNFTLEPIEFPFQIPVESRKIIKISFSPSTPKEFQSQLSVVYNQPEDAILVELFGKASISGVDDNPNSSRVEVLVNSSQNKLKIRINKPISELKFIYIVNSFGQTVEKFSVSQFDYDSVLGNFEVSFSNQLSSGLYIILIQTKNRFYSFPILILN